MFIHSLPVVITRHSEANFIKKLTVTESLNRRPWLCTLEKTVPSLAPVVGAGQCNIDPISSPTADCLEQLGKQVGCALVRRKRNSKKKPPIHHQPIRGYSSRAQSERHWRNPETAGKCRFGKSIIHVSSNDTWLQSALQKAVYSRMVILVYMNQHTPVILYWESSKHRVRRRSNLPAQLIWKLDSLSCPP